MFMVVQKLLSTVKFQTKDIVNIKICRDLTNNKILCYPELASFAQVAGVANPCAPVASVVSYVLCISEH